MKNDDIAYGLDCLTQDTHFAPAGRDSEGKLYALHQRIAAEPHVMALLNGIPLKVFILNYKRQIVMANQAACNIAGRMLTECIGMRPGELAGCIHSGNGPDGCGTNLACRFCGAVGAILESRETLNTCQEECRIKLINGQSLDWKVTTSPISLGGQQLICLAIEDISDQKRRQVLERTFFHDILNTIGALVGFSRMLMDEPGRTEELTEVIRLADELMEEVQSQRELTLAENGDLIPKSETLELNIFLSRLIELYRSHPAASGRKIVLVSFADGILRTDGRLLKRVLGNMIKNALEASGPGQTVMVSCTIDTDWTTLSVHNQSVMDETAKAQVFNRSFSTKSGVGRGIGTYSIKLLGEKYLGGKVSFTSQLGEGTAFSIALPNN